MGAVLIDLLAFDCRGRVQTGCCGPALWASETFAINLVNKGETRTLKHGYRRLPERHSGMLIVPGLGS